MKYLVFICANIFLLFLVGIGAFLFGKYHGPSSESLANPNKIATNTYKGRIYQISYPWNWIFEGPTEGPITGFPEFSKLISPSGDTQIVIGLKGDNRFEYVYDDIRQETYETKILIGNKQYQADEQFFDINEDPEFNIAILEAEISDKRLIGFTQGAREVSLPMKVQILYRFPSDDMRFEEKMKMYEQEKEKALEILQTLKLLPLD